MQIAERMLLQDCMMLSIDGTPKLQKFLQRLMHAVRGLDERFDIEPFSDFPAK